MVLKIVLMELMNKIAQNAKGMLLNVLMAQNASWKKIDVMESSTALMINPMRRIARHVMPRRLGNALIQHNALRLKSFVMACQIALGPLMN